MNRIPLQAEERLILGKKVKALRKQGFIPGHVFGKKIETIPVTVKLNDFLRVYHQAGESGLVDITISDDKIKPVLVREVQFNPFNEEPLHIDFYQVNLLEKVQVPVPVVLIGEQPEVVKSGEAVVIQPMSEVGVEALPGDLPEEIQVDISGLKQIDDVVLISQLSVPSNVTILAGLESVVVKLDNAITEEMKKLMKEQAAEQAAAAAAAAEAPTEGEAPVEDGEVPTEGEAPAEGAEAKTGGTAEEKPADSEQKPQ